MTKELQTPSPPTPFRRRPFADAPSADVFAMPVQYMKGVGPKKADFLKRLGISTVADLLYHLPRRYEDRSQFVPIAALTPDRPQTVQGTVIGHGMFRSKRGALLFQLAVKDASGTLYALWFNQPYMRTWFKAGDEVILYGKVERMGRRITMYVPEFELVTPPPVLGPKDRPAEATSGGQTGGGVTPEDRDSIHTGRIVPIYPSTSGLHQRTLRGLMKFAVDQYAAQVPELLPEPLRQSYTLPPLAEALRAIHFPASEAAQRQAEVRLGFDDLFGFQLAVAQRRQRWAAVPGIAHQREGPLLTALAQRLPFALTAGQRRAIDEILADMGSPHPMHRLLQGDVGSGKTVVAAFAVACAAQGGYQTALMAPTEILAEQHAATLRELLEPIGITVGLLTGSVPPEGRPARLRGIQEGTTQLVIGTHALLQESVAFHRLGLIIIDEQHKFGVAQRAALRAKGTAPDVLVMTATPIPRTLTLTVYGDLEVSALRELPPGRRPVETRWLRAAGRPEAHAFLRQMLDAGRQCYAVCPRIGPSEARPLGQQDLFELPEADLKAATKIFEHFRDRVFPGVRVGLLHGRLPEDEKDRVMREFKAGRIQLLVSTQVIEVGIDVPNATVMLIEQADRFGLAQLHQLRGRVGRGAHESYCLLVADAMTPEATARLTTMLTTHDGFEIAEHDLKLRGPGEVLGTRQSGLPELRLGALALDPQWLDRARQAAFALIAEDPRLAQPAHRLLAARLARQFARLEENKSFITS